MRDGSKPTTTNPGSRFDTAATRIDRLEENIAILRGLFGPDPLTFRGSHYAVTDLDGIPKPAQPGVRRSWSVAGADDSCRWRLKQADIVQVLGATFGSRGAMVDDLSSFRTESFEERLDWIRSAAGTRFDEIELSLMLVFVVHYRRRRENCQRISRHARRRRGALRRGGR